MYIVMIDADIHSSIESSLIPSVEQFTQILVVVTWTDNKGFTHQKYLNSNLIKSISVIQVGE